MGLEVLEIESLQELGVWLRCFNSVKVIKANINSPKQARVLNRIIDLAPSLKELHLDGKY